MCSTLNAIKENYSQDERQREILLDLGSGGTPGTNLAAAVLLTSLIAFRSPNSNRQSQIDKRVTPANTNI